MNNDSCSFVGDIRKNLHILNPHWTRRAQFNFPHDAVPRRAQPIRDAVRIHQMAGCRQLQAIVYADAQAVFAWRQHAKVGDVRRDETVVGGKFLVVHPDLALLAVRQRSRNSVKCLPLQFAGISMSC